jgi:Outer membrane lipoprotein-sorting protein
MRSFALPVFVTLALCVATNATAKPLSARQIVDKMLVHDFWGLSGADVEAYAILRDKQGKGSKLVFSAKSRKYEGYLTKSLVRFRSPPDLAGAGFLQIQNGKRDDDRWLYLPALKRSRRIASGQRRSSFMGTDFNFADMDRRDFRTGVPTIGKDTKVFKYDCYQIRLKVDRRDSPYSRLELLVRKDNFIPLKISMFNKSGVHIKTLAVSQIKRISKQWFITKSKMVNHKEKHQTTLTFSKIKPRDDIPFTEFTTQKLER